MKRAFQMLIGAAAALTPLGAMAEPDTAPLIGQPTPGALNFQPTVTPIGQQTADLHMIMVYVAVAISGFVLLLMAYTMIRFRASAHPTPKRFSHHVGVEVAWTVLPVVILLALIGPSLKLLYAQETVPEAGLVVKVTGNQWNWTYGYDVDGEMVEYTSDMLGKGANTYEQAVENIRENYPDLPEDAIPTLAEWKLRASAPLVAPVNTVVQVNVTASDVLHAFAVPAFGVKVDAVPGRLNTTWFNATQTGVFYGQCSELCGKDHSYMPIEVRIVSQEEFDRFMAEGLDALSGGEYFELSTAPAPEAVQVASQ